MPAGVCVIEQSIRRDRPSQEMPAAGLTARRRDSGDHTGGVTPVPIPNTAVKPAGPMIVLWRESRSSPESSKQSRPRTSTSDPAAAFFCAHRRGGTAIYLGDSASTVASRDAPHARLADPSPVGGLVAASDSIHRRERA